MSYADRDAHWVSGTDGSRARRQIAAFTVPTDPSSVVIQTRISNTKRIAASIHLDRSHVETFLFELLDAIIPFIRQPDSWFEGKTPEYGFSGVEDPRDFEPDSQANSAEEIASWVLACRAAERGEWTPVSHASLGPNIALDHPAWGMGTNWYRDEENGNGAEGE